MTTGIYQAQPPLEFIPPKLNPLLLQAAHLLLPSIISWKTAITHIEADNVEILADLYRQFQEGKIRFLLAFRHPKTEDPLCLGYLLSQLVPKVARAKDIKIQNPIHAHFIYDRGIPLWAGEHIGWLASHLGGTPIQRGKADWNGLRSARDLFANGKLPMAAAPEGATNGLSEIMSPLEPGIAQLGFWCAEDLHKAGRSEQVYIVPVGLKYSYVSAPWNAIAQLLSELEAASGLPINPSENGNSATIESLYPRLLTLAEHLLTLMEDFYKRFYHQKLPEAMVASHEGGDRNEALKARLEALMHVALQISEQYFDLQPKGAWNDRCRRLEQAGWNYIFREDFKDLKSLSPIERALGDRVAEEANRRMWHMRLVESFVAVSGSYVKDKPSVERFAETTLLLRDMVKKIQGNNDPLRRPQLGKQKVKITIGEPISISERYPAYKANRVGAKQAVTDFTNDLQKAMESLIAKEG
ncbi:MULTISPECIES: glycerol acyltransferase [unclassified Tolypothrix]|uniref:glycerol acyltransferase n=1 Tax=unclassified Tolypothrix TaxID=2649714 RepID=UPI0005EABE22|nr:MULTISPECIES: glycerol acyltransferase [unclassified Tolypothrix]BAY90702.1 phospholipid/glycerol acyltransferase [Microchaete diplosiphon NIES-3275]EKF01461.1 acyltransferase domain protein [Tolypothrix sp. PCC 7601]MBE9081089.1 1-acyl-sn-glycerol-3-phosphate acyltransferase [Tolypothrix sp. LEGE 11397]UYD24849.1 1-acyl-sn-glycerol-3-phosphate acyltransferase [Tolypothrix sp. PCC 7712]UYD32920.1 1-acyl-sn-glycerol-3-phosphate acyltransferase [Tolypothrix sp. PCC 7601]